MILVYQCLYNPARERSDRCGSVFLVDFWCIYLFFSLLPLASAGPLRGCELDFFVAKPLDLPMYLENTPFGVCPSECMQVPFVRNERTLLSNGLIKIKNTAQQSIDVLLPACLPPSGLWYVQCCFLFDFFRFCSDVERYLRLLLNLLRFLLNLLRFCQFVGSFRSPFPELIVCEAVL